MKRGLTLLVGIFLLLSISYISACDIYDQEDCGGLTVITGKVFYPGTSDPVGNAEVTVNCNGHEMIVHTLSSGLQMGAYFAVFSKDDCEFDDSVHVIAVKDELTGEESGKVEDWMNKPCDIDLARINIPLIPEFGTVIGIVTAISALGIFFVVRRK
jgi:hypothetical protein